MRVIFSFLLLLFFSLPARAEPQDQLLARLEAYLTSIRTIVSDFNQVAPDGALTSGKFYLKRPMQMLWQYNPPTPVLMVTRGSFLTYYDYELNQVSDVPLQDTLLSFLSQPKISFADKAVKVTKLEQGPGFARVTLVQRNRPKEGALMLEFSDHPLRLYNMQITDSTGQTTAVALNNARFDVALDDTVFAFKDPRIGGTKKGRKLPRNRLN